MAAHTSPPQDFGHSPMLDWILVLAGALLAWLLWPATLR